MSQGSARYRVVHETRYLYPQPVDSGRHLARLSPRPTAWQQCTSHVLAISPPPSEHSEGVDYFGNLVHRFSHDLPHDGLTVQADSEIVVDTQGPAWERDEPWEAGLSTPQDPPALAEFRLPSPQVPLLAEAAAYARPSFRRGRPLRDALQDLAVRMRTDFVYDPHATSVSTPVAEVIASRRGVCQDFAHSALSGLRALGLAARYLSGYVVSGGPAGIAELIGGAASHAWIAAYAPASGWIACDPTNGKLADLEFVTLGWGREYGDVTPLRGVVLGHGTAEPQVVVRVIPL
jgi:transglutaminase-like putative cysteine protease